MRIKHSIFSFIPFVLAMLALKLGSLLFSDTDGYFLGMSGMTVTYTVIGIALALFLVCIILNIFDRKTAPVYRVKKNPVAGILSILTGIAVAASSFMNVVNNQAESEYYFMTLITVLFAIPGAIALIVMSKVHFSGKTTISGISMLYIFPALWGCAELVKEFLNATKVSVSSTDMTGLFCYIFITLYFFYHAMIVSRVKGRNPVKACFNYGIPESAITITFGSYQICYASRAVENLGVSTLVSGVCLVLIGLYTLSVLIEMSTNTLSKDEVEIIENIPEDGSDEESDYVSGVGYNDLVFSEAPSSKNVKDNGISDYIAHTDGLDDFIMGYDAGVEEEEPVPYFTKEEKRKSVEEADSFVMESNGNDKFADEAKNETTPEKQDLNKKTIDDTPVVFAKPDRITMADRIAAIEAFTSEADEKISNEKSYNKEVNNAAPSKPSTSDEIDRILSETRGKSEAKSDVKNTEKKQMSDIDALLKQLDDMS